MDNSNNTTANQPIQPGQAPEKDNLKTAVIIIAVIAGLALLFGFFCVTTLFKIGWDYLWEQRDNWSDNSYEIDGKSPSQYMLDYVGERYNDECLYVHDKASDSIDELPSIIDDSQTSKKESLKQICEQMGKEYEDEQLQETLDKLAKYGTDLTYEEFENIILNLK